MVGESSSPTALVSAANEIEAAGIVSALAAYDIEASVTGGFTSGFKAEAPGSVQIVVRQSDLDRARAALAEIRADEGKIDWSTIDVGKPEE
jgi:hypothetical protein